MPTPRLLLPLLLLPAAAQGTDEDLLALSLESLTRLEVEIATGTPTPLAVSPAATTLLTSDDFRATGARTVDEALRGVPGLHVSPWSGPNGTTRYYFRGLSAGLNTQALMMVNGIPLTAVGIANLPLEGSLPLAQVERIEVIRGPGSAVHGVDAVGGVINIITHTAADLPGLHAGASAGSFDTSRLHLAQAGHAAGARALLVLAQHRTDGDARTIAADAQTLNDRAQGSAASLAPGPAQQGFARRDAYASLKWSQVHAHFYLRDIEDFDSSPGLTGALDPYGRLSWQRAGGDVTWHGDAPGAWQLEAQLSYWHTDIHTETPLRLYPAGAFGNAGGGVPLFPDGVQEEFALAEHTGRATLTALYAGLADHRLRFGAGWGINDLYRVRQAVNYAPDPSGIPQPLPGGLTDVSDTPAAGLPEGDRQVRFAFAQDEWQLHPDWTLTTGLRYDDFPDFGDVVTPRLALVWEASPALTAKLLYGEAFRAPSVTDLALGNASLDAERLQSIELGLGWQPDRRWDAELTVYALQARDLIELPANAPALSARNAGRSRGQGIEAELGYRHAGFRLRASASWQDVQDENRGESLGLAPAYQAWLRASQELGRRWLLTAELEQVGPRERAPGDPQADLAGYTSLGLHLRHQPRPGLEFFLTGRNLLDDDIREPGFTPVPASIPLPGRNVSVGLQIAH